LYSSDTHIFWYKKSIALSECTPSGASLFWLCCCWPFGCVVVGLLGVVVVEKAHGASVHYSDEIHMVSPFTPFYELERSLHRKLQGKLISWKQRYELIQMGPSICKATLHEGLEEHIYVHQH